MLWVKEEASIKHELGSSSSGYDHCCITVYQLPFSQASCTAAVTCRSNLQPNNQWRHAHLLLSVFLAPPRRRRRRMRATWRSAGPSQPALLGRQRCREGGARGALDAAGCQVACQGPRQHGHLHLAGNGHQAEPVAQACVCGGWGWGVCVWGEICSRGLQSKAGSRRVAGRGAARRRRRLRAAGCYSWRLLRARGRGLPGTTSVTSSR